MRSGSDSFAPGFGTRGADLVLNPFNSQDLFVGREAALSRLADRLNQGKSTLLIGGRRAGKTTLIRHLTPHKVGRALLSTDVSGWDLSSEQAALGALLGVVSGEQETTHSQASRHDVVMALRKMAPLALVIDEADRVRAFPPQIPRTRDLRTRISARC